MVLREALGLLWESAGRDEWEGEDDILGTLIQTVLSQSTTNVNSQMAFGRLLESFDANWDKVRLAELGDVVDAIRPGGLAKQKAPRIQGILEGVREAAPEGDPYDLQYLMEMEPSAAMSFLTGFRGVGPKTARFVLMFAAGAEVFPMDTHIFRILKRLEILTGDESDAKAHAYIEGLLDDGVCYAAHMVLVRHGREVCHARKPSCEQCVIAGLCAGSAIGVAE